MALETATRLVDLNASNPGPNDQQDQGDDHIRLLKTVLRNLLTGVPGVADPQTAQIINGEVTLSSPIVFLESETPGVGDSINKINLSGTFLGNVVILRPKSASEPITVEHLNSGNGRIILDNQENHLMFNVDHFIILFRDETTRWRELLRKPEKDPNKAYLNVINKFTAADPLQIVRAAGVHSGLRFQDANGDLWAQIAMDASDQLRIYMQAAAGGADVAQLALKPGGDVDLLIGLLKVAGKLVAHQGNLATFAGAGLQVVSEKLAIKQASGLASFNGGFVASANHGLGQRPDFFDFRLRCDVSQGGYGVGDEIRPHGWQTTGDADDRISMWASATQVGIAGDKMLVGVKNSSSVFTPSAGNWTWAWYAAVFS